MSGRNTERLTSSLRGMGFSEEEIEEYQKCSNKSSGSNEEQIRLITQCRKRTLEEIHRQEEQITRMDYLRNELQKSRFKEESK